MSEAYQAAETDRRLANLIMVGVVHEVDHGDTSSSPKKLPFCRVKVGDWVSAKLPIPAASAGAVRSWNPLSVGEQVTILSPSGEPAAGFIVSRHYTSQHGYAPSDGGKKVGWLMPDGCVIEYDHEHGALFCSGAKTVALHNSQTLTVESGGNVTIKAASITLDSDVTITKNLTVPNGDVTATGKSLISHTHGGVQPGSGNTNTPN